MSTREVSGGGAMTIESGKPLVIGISSRALFDLEVENTIFEEHGVAK